MISNDMVTVTAALMRVDGKYLIARRKKHKSLGGKWEFPGGKLEKGDMPQECLRRELSEELGIETVVRAYVGESIHSDDHQSIRLIAYRVEYVSGEFQLMDNDEIRWVSPETLGDFDLAVAHVALLRYLT